MSNPRSIACAMLLICVPVAHARDTTKNQELEIFELKRAVSELRETLENQQRTIESLRMRVNSTREKEIAREKAASSPIPPELDREITAALSAEEPDSDGRAGWTQFERPSLGLPVPRALQSLNLDISAVGDVVCDLSDNSNPLNRLAEDGGDRMSLREFELGFQAAVDPYVKGAAYVGFHDAHAHVEECYAQSLSLPWGLQAKGGRFFADFGKLNKVHTHDLPQVDRPLVLTRFFGEENLAGDGLNRGEQ